MKFERGEAAKFICELRRAYRMQRHVAALHSFSIVLFIGALLMLFL